MSATFRDDETVDFAIVGSGAAGGTLARELAMAGHSVVLFERGPRHTQVSFEHDELKYWFQFGLMNDPKHQPQSFRTKPSEVAQPPPPGMLPPAWYAQTVGGSTTHFTANYWRLHQIDFRERSALGPIAGTGFADWPISYEELEPYYTKVDWEVGVSGLAGAHPNEPPRSRPYPMPPLPVKSSGVLFERGARKLGLHPHPAPMAIASVPFRNRPGCIHCGFCIGYGCEVAAKSSTLYTMIPEAEATNRCEVRALSYVFRVPTNAAGRVTGVHYFDAAKREHFQKARAVILSANGAETARLLLASESARFPHGLANGSGLVGKYLMYNTYAEIDAEFEHPLNEFKSVQVTRILHDYYDSDPKRGYYGGGGLDARIGPAPLGWALFTPEGMPNWGPELKQRLEAFPRSMKIATHGTSLARETNSVSLDPVLRDDWGQPSIRVTYEDHPDDLANARFLQDRAMEIMDAAGALKTWRQPILPTTGGPHLLGTCRMGNDPASSVVDRHHRAHDVPNLFICDGSSLVTSSRGQPTMTIQALAFRAADHVGRFARANAI